MYDYRDGKYTIKNTDVDRSQYLGEAERRNTNWFKELFQHSIKHEHTISLASGNQKANYRTSLGATFDPGWSKFQNSQSYYFNLNANFKPHKDWTFGIIANASYLKERGYGDFKALDYAKTTTRTMDPDTYYAYQYTPFNIKHELKNNYTDYKTGDIRLQAPSIGSLFVSFASLRWPVSATRISTASPTALSARMLLRPIVMSARPTSDQVTRTSISPWMILRHFLRSLCLMGAYVPRRRMLTNALTCRLRRTTTTRLLMASIPSRLWLGWSSMIRTI